MKKIYLVWYNSGDWDDTSNYDCFVTDKEDIAINWCNKFNERLADWKRYFMKYEDQDCLGTMIDLESFDDVPKLVFRRFYKIMSIDQAQYSEIDFRTKKCNHPLVVMVYKSYECSECKELIKGV